jgi:hypothetical protein
VEFDQIDGGVSVVSRPSSVAPSARGSGAQRATRAEYGPRDPYAIVTAVAPAQAGAPILRSSNPASCNPAIAG